MAMKLTGILALAGLIVGTYAQALLDRGGADNNPPGKVMQLLVKLKNAAELDGRKEQKTFDKHQCWCERTLERKAKDISDAKDNIDRQQKIVTKLMAEMAAHEAEIKQLQKDIASNKAATKEASDIREQEFLDYNSQRAENEQCIGALQSAIRALTGAGAGGKKAGLLETAQETQLLSVAADISHVLQNSIVLDNVPAKDVDAIRMFISRHESMDSGNSGHGNLLQVSNDNPFGDFAPQSGQIQGILKSMYDAFVADVEKSNAEEGQKQQAFETFMTTKKAELATLQATLLKQAKAVSEKGRLRSDSRRERDETRAQLKADEVFFADTKVSCQEVAFVWAERSRMRTEELQGIITAVKILQNEQSQEIFKKATNTFVQIQSSHHSLGHRGSRHAQTKKQVFVQLTKLASKYGTRALGRVAALAQSGSNFRKVIATIDKMIKHIREEEASDIAHRDRCQNAKQKLIDNVEDAKSSQEQAKSRIARFTDRKGDLNSRIEHLEKEMKDTKTEIKERLELRNKEVAEFRKALKADSEAVDTLNKVIVALTAFYKKNGIPMTLVQKPPEYTIDQDKAPELGWDGEGDEYTGKKEETHGIIQILAMLADDYKHEMKVGRANDAKAQEEFEADREAMNEALHAQKESYVGAEQELAEIEAKLQEAQATFDQKGSYLSDEAKMRKTLDADCGWVKTKFAERRKKRKAELDGLAEAKNILAAAQGGNYDELMLMER